MDVAAHVSSSSLPFDHWRVSPGCYCAACYGGRFIIWFHEIKMSHRQEPSPRARLPARFATTAQRRRQLMARRDQIFPRDVRAVDLNLISRPAPFDDTLLPVIFSYRRMCIWDARSSLGDVSQSAERARKRCGAREARVDRSGVAGPRETLCNYRAW